MIADMQHSKEKLILCLIYRRIYRYTTDIGVKVATFFDQLIVCIDGTWMMIMKKGSKFEEAWKIFKAVCLKDPDH